MEVRNVNGEDNGNLVSVSGNVELSVGVNEVAFVIGFVHFSITVDNFEHVAVVSSGYRACSTVPSIDKVFCCEVGAVAPF